MQAQLQALPPLRPLLLVLKAALQQQGLDNAALGGLSSYSLLNMVRFLPHAWLLFSLWSCLRIAFSMRRSCKHWTLFTGSSINAETSGMC